MESIIGFDFTIIITISYEHEHSNTLKLSVPALAPIDSVRTQIASQLFLCIVAASNLMQSSQLFFGAAYAVSNYKRMYYMASYIRNVCETTFDVYESGSLCVYARPESRKRQCPIIK